MLFSFCHAHAEYNHRGTNFFEQVCVMGREKEVGDRENSRKIFMQRYTYGHVHASRRVQQTLAFQWSECSEPQQPFQRMANERDRHNSCQSGSQPALNDNTDQHQHQYQYPYQNQPTPDQSINITTAHGTTYLLSLLFWCVSAIFSAVQNVDTAKRPKTMAQTNEGGVRWMRPKYPQGIE